MTEPHSRNRPIYAVLIGVTIVVGLASRKFQFLLPLWLAKNAGDALYAVMTFWLAGFLLPRLPTLRTALVAAAFCTGIEFLKRVHASWLVAARHSHAGALVLGVGFHWSNLVCYAVGVGAAALAERALRKKGPPSLQ